MNHLLFSYHTCPMEEPGVGLSGGMNVFLRSLLPGLAAHGFRTDVLTRGKGTGVEITRPFPGVRIFHLPCGWRVPVSRESAWDALPRFVRKARKLLAADRTAYDIVSAHYWMSGIASLESGLRPAAFAYHTIEARKAGSAGTPPQALSAIRREAEKRLAREVSCVVCFSEDDLAGTREIFPAVARKGTVIPPGVDDAFRNPPPRAGARQKRGIPAGAFLFLLAAREDPGKTSSPPSKRSGLSGRRKETGCASSSRGRSFLQPCCPREPPAPARFPTRKCPRSFQPRTRFFVRPLTNRSGSFLWKRWPRGNR